MLAGAGLETPAHISVPWPTTPRWATRLSPPATSGTPHPSGASIMLRLQAPLPDRYTLATPDELDSWIAAAKAELGEQLADPRAPLPARRGHQVGRRPRRLVQARPLRRRQRPRHRHRVLRRALHGRVGRRAHRRPPAGDPARPQRRVLHGRHGRHRPGRGVLGRAGRRHRHRPGRADHLHELVGGAQGVRGRARRRGLHVVERTRDPRLGAGQGFEGPVLPRPAPRAQHRLRHGLRRQTTCGCGTRASSSAGSRSATSRRRRCCSGRGTARCTSASGPSTSPRSAPSTPTVR